MALVVFTGGVRSGKSAAASELARIRSRDGASVIVAVFGDASGDAEMAARIARHQADRPAEFEVLEVRGGVSWPDEVPDGALLLLDCVGTMVSRIMAEAGADCPAETLESKVDEVVSRLLRREGDTIVVTNEVGDGVVPAYASGRLFRDVLGRANRTLVSAADAAYLVTAGRLLDLTAMPRAASWPTD